MKCRELEQTAIAYLDGKLPLSERGAVEEHLAACSACRERVQDFSSVMGMLGEWPDIQPSPFFQTRLAARLKEEPARQSWWVRLWEAAPAHRAARPVFAIALAVVLAIGAVLIEYSPGPLESNESTGTPELAVMAASRDELPLYQDLPLLEDYEVLQNFEVLQALQ
jgi:anti-sigma factor RsiW